MSFETTLAKIKERGYWVVNFHPVIVRGVIIDTPTECGAVVKRNRISLRGWDYPHISSNNDHGRTYVAGEATESFVDWERFKEVWKFYQSGQFISVFGIYNDWFEEMEPWGDMSRFNSVAPNEALDYVELLYRTTEILQFLKKLCLDEVYTTDIVFKLTLNNMQGRKLITTDGRRASLSLDYICHSDQIEVKKVLQVGDIIANSESIALEIVGAIFEQFQWGNFPKASFSEEQVKLVNRQLF